MEENSARLTSFRRARSSLATFNFNSRLHGWAKRHGGCVSRWHTIGGQHAERQGAETTRRTSSSLNNRGAIVIKNRHTTKTSF
jgi:hypothetical protein